MKSPTTLVACVALAAVAVTLLVVSSLQENGGGSSPEIETDVEARMTALEDRLDGLKKDMLTREYLDRVVKALQEGTSDSTEVAQLQEELAGLKTQLATSGGQARISDDVIADARNERDLVIDTRIANAEEEKRRKARERKRERDLKKIRDEARKAAAEYARKIGLDAFQTGQMETALSKHDTANMPRYRALKSDEATDESRLLILHQLLDNRQNLFRNAGAFLNTSQLAAFQERHNRNYRWLDQWAVKGKTP